MAPNNIRFAEPFWVSLIKVQQFFFQRRSLFIITNKEIYANISVSFVSFPCSFGFILFFFCRPDFIFHRNFMAKFLIHELTLIQFSSLAILTNVIEGILLYPTNVYSFERNLEKKFVVNAQKSERKTEKTGICNETNTEPH